MRIITPSFIRSHVIRSYGSIPENYLSRIQQFNTIFLLFFFNFFLCSCTESFSGKIVTVAAPQEEELGVRGGRGPSF